VKARVTRPRLAIGMGAMVVAAALAVVAPLTVPAASSDDQRTIDASITNGLDFDITVAARAENGTITSQTGPTPFVIKPGKTFELTAAGPEYSPCDFDDAETCLETIMLVDAGDTTSSPTAGFRKVAQKIDISGEKEARVPGKEGAGGANLKLGNGGWEWTFDAWNPRGEPNQTCVDGPQGFDVSEDDSGIAVLDFEVDWTITRDAQYGPALDSC
jgi:hypothetical protein